MADLVQIVDAALADAARRSGAHLACRMGCTQCCVGVFAISQQDAARLRAGLDALAQADAARAERVRKRVAASVERLLHDYPGDPVTGLLAEDYASRAFFDGEFANNEICPALDPASGACDLYSSRPILCRTFGPPMRDEDGNLTACELCFTTAEAEEIEACEMDPAIGGLEAASNEAFDARHGTEGETVVAFALHVR